MSNKHDTLYPNTPSYMPLSILTFFLFDVVLDALYLPLWWYTKGFLGTIMFLGSQTQTMVQSIGLGIWLKSMFKPMYGVRSVQGRIISFFMRLVVLIWKLLFFIVWVILMLVMILCWLVFLPALLWQILSVFHGV